DRELVSSAMDKYKMKRFAIVFPNDAYGVEFANLFWDEVLTRGGQITAAQSYSNSEKDFSNVISRLVGTYYLDDRSDEYTEVVKDWYAAQKNITSRVIPPNDLLTPIVDFDGIFIPDGVTALVQIASMLKSEDVKNVRLLGTNLWNKTTLLTQGANLVENALFVDATSSVDKSLQNLSFFKEYQSIYDETPSAFEAQAYDTGLTLKNLITQGARTRIALREALSHVNNIPGSVGNISITAEREFTRPLTLLTVQDNKILPAKTSSTY
ncbi:MAG: penicillin-binding protein activator, partial [Bdellovibrionales bacterium]